MTSSFKFEYTSRWAVIQEMLKSGQTDDAMRALEDRDRKLEEFLNTLGGGGSTVLSYCHTEFPNVDYAPGDFIQVSVWDIPNPGDFRVMFWASCEIFVKTDGYLAVEVTPEIGPFGGLTNIGDTVLEQRTVIDGDVTTLHVHGMFDTAAKDDPLSLSFLVDNHIDSTDITVGQTSWVAQVIPRAGEADSCWSLPVL